MINRDHELGGFTALSCVVSFKALAWQLGLGIEKDNI